jgi:hypothetical protein
MSDRVLLSTRRRIPPDHRARYDECWSRIEAQATEHGFHAWRFQSRSVEELWLDFLEFRGNDDPRVRVEVARALEEIRRHFPDPAAPPAAPEEEWQAVEG